jgi:hypothetical protein
VPRHVAPGWLVDARGDVKAEFAEDYELVGKKREGKVVLDPVAPVA